MKYNKIIKVIAVVAAVAVIGGIGACAIEHNRQPGQDRTATEDTRTPKVEEASTALEAENPYADRIAYAKEQLGIPADLETKDVADFDNPSYWEAGDMWLVNCEFYHDGKLVATAMVNKDTGEPVRNIMAYSGK